MTTRRWRVRVVGGGISGLAVAHHLLQHAPDLDVAVLDAEATPGGKIRTSPFAGLPAVDEGADAFLARVPWAAALARAVGLGDQLVSPSTGAAAVWWHQLRRLPEGLLLGMPTDPVNLARSGLLSWRGTARAALEPLLPRRSTDHDSLGAYVRSRFGNEVHERLVDPLVGSIYAADTDRFSLRAVPQIADLATAHRSVLLAARSRPAPPAGPVFFTPRGGLGDLVAAVAGSVVAAGGQVRTSHRVECIEQCADGWVVDGEQVDAVVFATPAAATARLLRQVAPHTADGVGSIGTADVVLVSAAVPIAGWPEHLRPLSGYLVPKPVQRLVTAVSFGSQKWAHWALPDRQVLRISLGRDGLPVLHLDDDAVVAAAIDETSRHLGLDLQPTELRISRWPGAFPQYRPHHHRLVVDAEQHLPPGLALAGASYHGIGVPACVQSAERAATAVLDWLDRRR